MAQFEAKEIGGRIAQARKESGLTQEELAELAPFSKRSLQDYETGITIPYRHLREISKLLARPIEYFLHGEEPDRVDLAELLAKIDALEAQLRKQEDGFNGRFDALDRELESLLELARTQAATRA